MRDSERQLVIVGGGVIGFCTAYYALRAGLGVTVLEREPKEGDNCSMGNAGMVVPSHFVPLAAPGMIAKGLRWMLDPKSPFYVKPRLSPELARWGWLFYRHSTADHVAASRELLRDLNLESRRLFAELAGECEFGWVPKGLLMLCNSAKGMDAEAELAKEAAEIGVEADIVDPAGAAKLDPGVRMSVQGAVHYKQDCHLNPRRFMQEIRRRVVELGGQIEYGVEIDRVQIKGSRVRAVSSGERKFEGERFVIAGGSWTAGLLRQVGLKLPLQAGKGYSLTLDQPPELPELCSIFSEAKVAITPMGSTLRFAGTMEVGGNDLSVNPMRVKGIVQSVPRYFPGFGEKDFEGIEPWAGLRPVSPDGIPYLGPVDGLENLHASTGHAMMGLSLGPVTGRLMADLLTGSRPFRPIEALAVGRFG